MRYRCELKNHHYALSRRQYGWWINSIEFFLVNGNIFNAISCLSCLLLATLLANTTSRLSWACVFRFSEDDELTLWFSMWAYDDKGDHGDTSNLVSATFKTFKKSSAGIVGSSSLLLIFAHALCAMRELLIWPIFFTRWKPAIERSYKLLYTFYFRSTYLSKKSDFGNVWI